VLLVPAHTAPHKADGEDPGPQHRLEMCRLAVRGEAGLSVCPLEIERGGLSYTVDTVRSVHAGHPDAQLTFILGADTASTLSTWHEPRQLLGLAHLAVAARAGAAQRRVLDSLRELELERQEVSFLEMPPIEVSSSMARARVAAGEPIEELVGPAVAAYISDHGLYRTRIGAPA